METAGNGRFLKFSDTGEKDVYNPTAPFMDRGITYLAARVESRRIETDTQVWFFREVNGVWQRDPGTLIFNLQDPFISRIGDEWVFGGVVFPVGDGSWRTDFYRGRDLPGLEKFAEGPLGMKDVRLVELHDGMVGVFTRPQGEIGGRGKIGFTIIDSLDRLDENVLVEASLLPRQHSDDEWSGVNAAYVLKQGLIGALGHIAHFSENADGQLQKHYRSMVFTYNYLSGETSPVRIIAERKNFPPGEAKRSPELDDIVISGGLRFPDSGCAVLYVGISDVRCGVIDIDDPFSPS